MLQTIRDYTQGWVASIIIGLIILTFALWGIHSYFTGGNTNTTVAEVNGTEITQTQFHQAYERIRHQTQMQFGPTQQAIDENRLKKQALQDLIEIEVLKQAAQKQGFTISDQQVDAFLQRIPEFQINGQFSIEHFQAVLSSLGLSPQEFFSLLKTSMVIDQPKLGIVFSSFALPIEVQYLAGLIGQERRIDYFIVPFQEFLKELNPITSSQIKQYYETHRNDFMVPEQVSVEYLILSLKDIAANSHPHEEELRKFYKENATNYRQPKMWKLVGITVPVPSNANEAEIKKTQIAAQEVVEQLKQTDNPKHSYQQILNGEKWVSLNEVPSELQKTILLLKNREVSQPIQTATGFTVIKLIGMQESHPLTYDQVKERVKEQYIRQQATEQFAEQRERLAEQTYEHPNSLIPASQALGLSIKTSEFFSKEVPGQDVFQSPKIRAVAFNHDVITLQNNSDVIPVDNESVVVLRLKDHKNSSSIPLTQVAKQIETKLQLKASEARAETWVFQLIDQLNQGLNPDLASQGTHFSWIEAGFVARNTNKPDSAIVEKAFTLPKPQQGKASYDVVRISNGYAVIALKEIRTNLPSKKEQNIFTEQTEANGGILEYDLYKQSLITNAKVQLY